MRPTRTTLILLALTIGAAIAGLLVYPSLPPEIASHWNAAGEADGTMTKFWGVFLFPMIMAVMFLIYVAIPSVDPLKKNIASFRKYYDLFWVAFFLYFLYIFGLSIAWNLGARFDFTVAILPSVAVLFYIVGILLEHTKRNWFIGIRTPWTLSSDVVWDKTHELGARLFKASAIIAFIGAFLGGTVGFITLLVPTILSSFTIIIYSYVIYRDLPMDERK